LPTMIEFILALILILLAIFYGLVQVFPNIIDFLK